MYDEIIVFRYKHDEKRFLFEQESHNASQHAQK